MSHDPLATLSFITPPQAVVLAHRPPISIPRTTVSPALLEELLGEISSLASVYHKPEETFIGRGRVGADSVQRKGTELVFDNFLLCFLSSLTTTILVASRTIDFRPKRLYRQSLRDNKPRTCCEYECCETKCPLLTLGIKGTLTMNPLWMANHPVWRQRRYCRRHRGQRTSLRVLQPTLSTTWSRSLEEVHRLPGPLITLWEVCRLEMVEVLDPRCCHHKALPP